MKCPYPGCLGLLVEMSAHRQECDWFECSVCDLNFPASIQAELAELRKWDARDPKVQAKVLEVGVMVALNEENGDSTAVEVDMLCDKLRTGKRPALELEEGE